MTEAVTQNETDGNANLEMYMVQSECLASPEHLEQGGNEQVKTACVYGLLFFHANQTFIF